MRTAKPPADATLLDVLIDGFEKNEILDGFHWRELPLPDEETARRKFEAFAEEARRWKGRPRREETAAPRRVAAWEDLELRQVGRGLMVRVRAPWFSDWWNKPGTWDGDPFGPIHEWIAEESPLER